MGVTCGDIDNDGRIDLYVANMYSKAGNRVIGNLRPGTYTPDVMARLRTWSTGSQLYLNRGELRFEPVASEVAGGERRLGLWAGPGRPGQRRLARPVRHLRLHQQNRDEPDG